MTAPKKAISISTADIDGDGTKDLTVTVGGDKLFTIMDIKNVLLKVIGTAGGGGIILALAQLI